MTKSLFVLKEDMGLYDKITVSAAGGPRTILHNKCICCRRTWNFMTKSLFLLLEDLGLYEKITVSAAGGPGAL